MQPINPSMGINISRIDTYGPGFQTLDLMRQADGWRTVDFSNGFDETREFDPVYLDANGWPRQMPDGEDAGQIWYTRVAFSDDLPDEVYVLTYEGTADITVQGNILSDEPGRITFTPATSIGGDTRNSIQIFVEGIETGDPLTEVEIYRLADEALVDAGEIWRPTYLDQVGQFRVIRPMDFVETNFDNSVDWDPDRQSIDRAIWTEGAPMEAAIDLANATNADLWLNIPHAASDDYVVELARLVRDTLDPELRVYVEYTNEHWTTIFDQHQWLIDQGIALFGSDAPFPGVQFYVYRAAQVLEIFETEFGDDARVETVLTSAEPFAELPDYMDAFLNAPDADRLGVAPPSENPVFENIAVDTYFDSGLIFSENVAQVKLWFETLPEDEARDRVINALLTGEGLPTPISFAELAANYAYFSDVAQANGWDLMSYEGGSFLITDGEDPAFTDFIMSINRDPRIVAFNEQIFETFIAEGGGLIMAFADTGYDGPFGNWAAYDTGFDAEPNLRGSVPVNLNGVDRWFDLDDTRDAAFFLDDRLQSSGPVGELLVGTTGDDMLESGTGDDELLGLAGDDDLISRAGEDTLRGGADNDTLNGGDGDDLVIGGYGDDLVQGKADNDILIGGRGRDTLKGGFGDDRLSGGTQIDSVVGGSGDDTLLGQNGDDLLVGGDDEDRLIGGAGADRLIGGADRDVLIGGAGEDMFVFRTGDGNDVIIDLDLTEDTINLRAFSLPSLPAALNLRAVGQNDTRLVLEGGDTTVLIRGVTPDELRDSDVFIF